MHAFMQGKCKYDWRNCREFHSFSRQGTYTTIITPVWLVIVGYNSDRSFVYRLIYFFHPIFFFFSYCLFLPSSRNSDSGSLGRFSFPLPTTYPVHALNFLSREEVGPFFRRRPASNCPLYPCFFFFFFLHVRSYQRSVVACIRTTSIMRCALAL